MDLSYLASLSEHEFERERSRLISEAIKAAPQHLQKNLYALQLRLDAARLELTSEMFMALCFREARENMENVSDQLLAVCHTLGLEAPRNTGIR